MKNQKGGGLGKFLIIMIILFFIFIIISSLLMVIFYFTDKKDKYLETWEVLQIGLYIGIGIACFIGWGCSNASCSFK